ncbi:MAG: outer membrane lipoprotein LolB [Alcaligenaceae bacterium]|nr:outer membrane lipoprotein LolB [Alcaligenaceae bacterium]
MKPFKQFFRYVGALSLIGLLAACAPALKQPTTQDDGTYSRAGRFALNVWDKTIDRNKDAVQGGFLWLDTRQRLELDLRNPLGSTLARVSVTPDSATLVHADGSQVTAENPDALVAEVLGSEIPVSGLRYWLKGIVAPAKVELEQRDAQGRPGSFTQAGWKVTLSDYDHKGPRKLGMVRNETFQTITVRLVINE